MPKQLANELVDVIHYTFAIASLNKIDLPAAILEKDKKASIKYNHTMNLAQFLLNRWLTASQHKKPRPKAGYLCIRK